MEVPMKHFKRTLIHYVSFNLIISVFLSFGAIYIYARLQSVNDIDWIQLHTKRSVMIFGCTWILLLLTIKWQALLVDKVKKYKLAYRGFRLIVILTSFMILAFMSNLFLQYSHDLHNLDAAIDWMQDNKELFIRGAFFLFSFYLLVYALVGDPYLSNLLSSLVISIIGFAHFQKLSFLGEPLYPSDVSQVSHISEVIPMVSDSLSWKTFFVIMTALTLAIILWKYFDKIKLHWGSRIVVAFVGIFLFSSLLFYPKSIFADNINSYVSNDHRWNQISNYKYNGFVFGFITNLHNDVYEKPAEYKRDRMLTIKKEIEEEYNQSKQTGVAPKDMNVIFLMSETFWDPTKLPVEYSEDPIKQIREIMNNHSSGSILSPTFGGGTANVEFEALTGFSMSFLQQGAIPYQELIKNDQAPSVVKYFKQSGYRAVAIHPHSKVFYKRNHVYKYLGFDEFIGKGELQNEKISGRYVADESVTKEIIHHLENEKDPLFIHAVTMQNHYPYREDQYKTTSIEVSGIADHNATELEVYAEGLRQTDVATKELIDFLDQHNEKTILVFWGDHLPILGTDREIYRVTNFANYNETQENTRELRETPFFIYANFDMDRKELGTVSPAFISPVLFEVAGLEMTPYIHFLQKVQKEIPGLMVNIKIGSDDQLIENLSEEQQELLDIYNLIQYDLLVGKQYTKDLLDRQ